MRLLILSSLMGLYLFGFHNSAFAQSGSPSSKLIDSLKKENEYLRGVLKLSTPIKEGENDGISFRITKIAGNKLAQTITIEMLLTDLEADVSVFSTSVQSIIDMEGNEYKLLKFTLGKDASVYIELHKDTPLKCVYVFSGIIKDIQFVKRFELPYRVGRGSSLNSTQGKVFFTDLPISWK